MEAIILAGGLGTRIRPLTYTRPKPLLPVLNRPLLQLIIDQMPASVKTILLPVGYLHEQIESYFEDHPDGRVVLVEEERALGTGGAIKNCEEHLTGPFLVYNGDIVASLDLARLQEAHAKYRAKATISLWPVQEPWHFGVADLQLDGRISRFVEKPPQGREPSNLINAGHYALDLAILDELRPGRTASLEREVFEPWAREARGIYGFRFEGYWVDCGRPEAFLEAHEVVLRATGRTSVADPTARVEAGATFLGYALGADCRLARGAHVEQSILLPGCHVGDQGTVRDSVLGEGVEVEAGAVLERCVVGDFGIIEAGSRFQDQRVGLRAEDVTTA